MRISVLIVLVAVILATGPVGAEHEADHRYTVEGYVLGVDQNPLAGVPVVIRLGDDRSTRGTTDNSGHYSLRLHVHNADLGKRIAVSAGAHSADVQIAFDPGNTTTSRIHYANFVGGTFSETRITRGLDQWRFLIWIAVGVVAIAVVAWSYRARTRQKQRQRQQPTPPKRGAKRRRKRKR